MVQNRKPDSQASKALLGTDSSTGQRRRESAPTKIDSRTQLQSGRWLIPAGKHS